MNEKKNNNIDLCLPSYCLGHTSVHSQFNDSTNDRQLLRFNAEFCKKLLK